MIEKSRSNNSELHKARKRKFDEYYTRYNDIDNEVKNYKSYLSGKSILCNCDDPLDSEFTMHFLMNFNNYGLKRLVACGYAVSPYSDAGVLSDLHPYILDVQSTVGACKGGCTDLSYNEAKDFVLGNRKYLVRSYSDSLHEECDSEFNLGDFRSKECIKLLDECDIVITNPPFSLFSEYLTLLMNHNKKFLIIGSINALTYKSVFPLIKENKIWTGFTFNKTFEMIVPTSCRKVTRIDKGKTLTKMCGLCWYTNLPVKRRTQPLDLYKHFSEEEYPRYDNYLAWNVDKTADIPMDESIVVTVKRSELANYKSVYPDLEIIDQNYESNVIPLNPSSLPLVAESTGEEELKVRIHRPVYGVPITFIGKYCPEQFEIVSFRKGDDGNDLVFNVERERVQPYCRVLVRRR